MENSIVTSSAPPPRPWDTALPPRRWGTASPPMSGSPQHRHLCQDSTAQNVVSGFCWLKLPCHDFPRPVRIYPG
eukprot:2096538-Alexandrium_andersonii.AAC.1